MPARRWTTPRLIFPSALVLALALAGPLSAAAHMRTSTFSQLALRSGSATWEVKIAAADLMAPLGLSETLSPEAIRTEVWRHRHRVQAYVGAKLMLFAGPVGCVQTPDGFATDAGGEPGSLLLRFVYRCPVSSESYRARYDLFFDLDALHSGFVNVSLAGAPAVSDVFRNGNRELSLLLSPALGDSLRRFWLLGVEHIFTGYDHLAFLAALLLLATVGTRASRDHPLAPATARAAFVTTAQIVTAFTISHSLTLVAAALRPNLVPTDFVEPAIALSVAAVGAENLLPRMPRRRWVVAFVFGLIHGLGFASVLSEIGLPSQGLLATLLAFNVGVECGQLCVVVLVLPLLLMAAKRFPRLYHRVFLLGGSAALVVAGLVWFAQRL